MDRRRVLALFGAGAVVGLAGCSGGGDTLGDPGERNDSERASTTARTPTGDANPDDSLAADRPCPPYSTSRSRAVCSHTVDTASAPVVLEPAPARTALESGAPEEEVSLTLHNRSSSDLTFNPRSWRIWHNPGTGWSELARQLSGDGTLTLSSGAVHSWSLTEAATAIRENPVFEPGLYAAELGVPAPGQGDAWLACIALVELSAAE